MKFTILGYLEKPYNFTDEKTGEINKGVSRKVWVGSPISSNDKQKAHGVQPMQIKCTEEGMQACHELQMGEEADLDVTMEMKKNGNQESVVFTMVGALDQ